MGTVFSRVEWPIFLMIGFTIASIVLTVLGCMAKSSNRILFFVPGLLMWLSVWGCFPAAFPNYTANTIQYPAEKASNMELVKALQPEAQGNNTTGGYYKTEQTADGTTNTVFVVKNPNGVEQHVVIDSKQVKVHQDLQEGQAPYAVKHQAVYTNKRIYQEGETPLCLKDVNTGCQPNAVLNTGNENDNMYDLHVPASAG